MSIGRNPWDAARDEVERQALEAVRAQVSRSAPYFRQKGFALGCAVAEGFAAQVPSVVDMKAGSCPAPAPPSSRDRAVTRVLAPAIEAFEQGVAEGAAPRIKAVLVPLFFAVGIGSFFLGRYLR